MSEQTSLDPERYEKIDQASDHSWYMTQERPFEVFQSVGTIKPSAEKFGGDAVRLTLAGNMSHLYPKTEELTDDDRYTLSLRNMMHFYKSIGLTPADMLNTAILNPQREKGQSLQAINVDEYPNKSTFIEPAIMPEKADFLYTRDPNRVLAGRPADCPIILATGDTPEGKTLMLTHFAWLGAASGFVDQAFDQFDALGVDRDSLKVFVTPGGQAENYPYTNEENPLDTYPDAQDLFVNLTKTDDGYRYAIDTPNFVYKQLLKNGLKPEQIYADTSDTSRPDSGYSSNGRANRDPRETNIRDIIIAKMN